MNGNFNSIGNEYIIKDHSLKRPMLNYFWNDNILIGVNNNGGGNGGYRGNCSSMVKYDDKPRAQLIRNGNRYFYVLDEETGELWNPGWYPTKTAVDGYLCVHGLGYTSIGAEKDGIRVDICGCAPGNHPAELWEITVSNKTEKKRYVKMFPFVEFSLEGYVHASEYDSWVHTEYEEDRNLILAINNAEERPHEWFHGFCATSIKAYGFESSKKKFIGEYGFISEPDALKKGKLSNSLAACEDMVGVLENRIELFPGETIKYYFVVGLADSRETARECVSEVFGAHYFDKNLAEIADRYNNLSESFIMSSADKQIDNFVNFWLKKQASLCAEVGRGAGKGFRDQLQDAWAVAGFDSALAKEKIIETLEHIYSTGITVRGWNPIKERNMSDSATWVAPVINAYLKETHDFEFLDQKVKYLDHGEDTVWEHILTTTRYSSDDKGKHGMVLAHEGDWNDSLNHLCDAGIGESVWSSMALYNSLLNVAEMAHSIKNDPDTENEMLKRAKELKDNINKYAWDGEWYLAGYNDLGEKVGTRTEKEGKIYLNTQTWAAITGVAEPERIKKCIESVDKYLSSDYGPLTLYPAYTSYNINIGRLTGFEPGVWENGAPYCHGGAFKAVCDCVLGRADIALQTIKDILPDSEKNPSDHSGCEPYAVTNMYLGPDNLRKGETSSAWITGTAGWLYRAVTEYMLGFYPGYEKIILKPCIPTTWESVKYRRRFRDDIYDVEIIRNNGSASALKVKIDGKQINGNEVSIFGDGKKHTIQIEI